jgi:hypothetical protein
MTKSSSYRSTHERLNTATYVETQCILKFTTLFNVDLNVNSNVDSNSNLDLNDSNSNLFFAHFVFTSFLMRIISSRIHSTSFNNLHDKKLFDDKKLSRKIYKVKSQKKITHAINKFMIIFMIIFLQCYILLT